MVIEAMKRWLEAIERANELDGMYYWKKEEESLRQAIADSEKQEPVAFALFRNGEIDWDEEAPFSNEYFGVMFDDEECKPLYTHPQPRKPLTDEQIGELKGGYQSGRIGSFVELVKTIEAAHGIKE
jgi:hypothetical protein